MRISQVAGTGAYLPGPAITNDDLIALFGRRIKPLCQAIGVQQRHLAVDPSAGWARTGVQNSEMAAHAARAALDNAATAASSIDLIVLVTATPNYPFPATVTLVQELLDIQECTALELRGACAGVPQAICVADLFIRAGRASAALVIGSELSSSLVDLRSAGRSSAWPDDLLISAVMFGDGAGAMVLTHGETNDKQSGVFATVCNSVGVGRPPGFLCRTGGSSSPAGSPAAEEPTCLSHDFRAILELGPKLVVRAFDDLRRSTGLELADFQVVVPPQANPMLTRGTLASLGVAPSRVFLHADKVGNTSSASLLIALNELNREGKLVTGDRIALLGAEASKWLYGAVAITWSR